MLSPLSGLGNSSLFDRVKRGAEGITAALIFAPPPAPVARGPAAQLRNRRSRRDAAPESRPRSQPVSPCDPGAPQRTAAATMANVSPARRRAPAADRAPARGAGARALRARHRSPVAVRVL